MHRDDPELAQLDTRDAQHAQPAAQAIPPDRPGRLVLGSYRIGRLLSTTAIGPIHHATHVGLARPASLLRLQASPGADPTAVERAMREVRAFQLEHPAVIGLRDVAIERDGAIFLVLEELEGESLAAYVARRGHLDPEHAVTLLAPVLDALGALHRRGLAHGANHRDTEGTEKDTERELRT